MTWKHFPHYWPFVKEIHLCPVDSLHICASMRSYVVSFFSLNMLSNNYSGWQERKSETVELRMIQRCFIAHVMSLLTHWPLGDLDAISKLPFSISFLSIVIFTSSKDNALRWMPRNLTDDKSTLVQVMSWCRQAPSHYLSQCWPSSMSPYGVTRPQWVNVTISLGYWD